MKLIGLDVGTRRIGVARADTDVRISVPQCTINVDGTEMSQIARLSRVLGVKFFVVGLPRNNNGEETEQSKYSRAFARKLLSEIPGAKVAFQDESLTSVMAEERLKNKKGGIKKGDVDAEAAAIILQDFLENFANFANASRRSVKEENRESGGKSTERVYQKMEAKIKQPEKRMSSGLKSVLLIGLTSAVVCVFLLTLYVFVSLKPAYMGSCEGDEAQKTECEDKTLVINEGMTSSEIATALKNEALIRSDLVFRAYTYLAGKAGELKSGTFTLNPTMSMEKITEILTDGKAGVVSYRITTIPGETLEDFRMTLKRAGFSEDEINEALDVDYDNPIMNSKPEGKSLEGYIFGETIEYTDKDGAKGIISRLIDELEKTAVEYNLEEKYNERGLSFYEGVVLASVVQKEANSYEDMVRVAGVFYNRLAIGMPLGSDVTVQYALDLIDKDREYYTDNDLALTIDSCYNTRVNEGLPCGPISNPGVSALRAVAEPERSDYLYFLTGDDGEMHYAVTDDEHNGNIIEYCKELCNVKL